MQSQIVPVQMIDEIWPRVETWIGAALEKGDRWWTPERLRQELKTNPRAALFLVIDRTGIHAACVAMVETKPSGEIEGHLPACGGVKARAWLHLFDDVESWAKGQGASVMSVGGRRGWQRLLSKRGYGLASVTLEKAL